MSRIQKRKNKEQQSITDVLSSETVSKFKKVTISIRESDVEKLNDYVARCNARGSQYTSKSSVIRDALLLYYKKFPV